MFAQNQFSMIDARASICVRQCVCIKPITTRAVLLDAILPQVKHDAPSRVIGSEVLVTLTRDIQENF
jgi:hypothetical protein